MVSDLEMMVKTTCELGTHWERLNDQREPVTVMKQLDAYHNATGPFPSMVRRVLAAVPKNLVSFLLTN